MHQELCVICVKQSPRDRLSSQWEFHCKITANTSTSFHSINFALQTCTAALSLAVFILYVLPDRRLTSYFQAHYSSVTPGQSEKSQLPSKPTVFVKNPRPVISSLGSFSAKCEALIISKTLLGLMRPRRKLWFHVRL